MALFRTCSKTMFKVNSTKILISKVSTDSYISHNVSVSVNTVLREYNDMRERNRKFKDFNSSWKILIYL